MTDAFNTYIRTFDKVKSGTKLTNADYMHLSALGASEMSQDEKLAVSMAAQDVKVGAPMKSKSEFEAELARLKE